MFSKWVVFGPAVLLAGFILACATTRPGRSVAVLVPHRYTGKITKTVDIQYYVFLPKTYEKNKQRWPLMLFLHGAGERGSDLKLVKKHGPPRIAEEKGDFPFVLVVPQCPDNAWWSSEILAALLDRVISDFRIDKDRVVVTGLSMGGFGTWDLGIEYQDRFAALAPICGGGNPVKAAQMKDIPVWAFHGNKDPVVPLVRSQEMVDALTRSGGNVRLTVYPEAGHDSWTETYANPELYEWLLAQKRFKK